MVKTINLNNKQFNIVIDEEKQSIIENKDFRNLYKEIIPILQYIIKKYYIQKLPIYNQNDIMQELLIEFLVTLQKFDSSKNNNFCSFLTLRASQKIFRIYRDEAHLNLIKKYFIKQNNTYIPNLDLKHKKKFNDAVLAYGLLHADYISTYLDRKQEIPDTSFSSQAQLLCY